MSSSALSAIGPRHTPAPSVAESEWSTTIAALKIASYFTDPICNMRECYYTLSILDQTCESTAEKVMQMALLTFKTIAYGLLAIYTAPIGIAIRGAVAAWQTHPFIYIKRDGEGKTLPENKQITLVSHNECYMPAGYSITDGQVTPPSDKARIDANIEKIKALDPDVVCLYEVPDICDAEYISSKLSDYPFVIPVAGVRAVGTSSMMYVASKYEIVEDSIEFDPFVKEIELTGRAKYSEKGILSFSLKSKGDDDSFATIFSTHLQHSEIPAEPTEEDVKSRQMQMQRITQKIENLLDTTAVIFTGDLNQEEQEINTFFTQREITYLRRDPSVTGEITWGGDEWCAKLMDKEASSPLVLDYTYIAGKATSIATKIFETGYVSNEFKPDATSDHYLLSSRITVA